MTTYTNANVIQQQAVIAADRLAVSTAQATLNTANAQLQADLNQLNIINNTIALAAAQAAEAALATPTPAPAPTPAS